MKRLNIQRFKAAKSVLNIWHSQEFLVTLHRRLRGIAVVIICCLAHLVCHAQSVALPLNDVHVTSLYGMRSDPLKPGCKTMHYGMDLRAYYENVYSMFAGIVLEASYSSKSGYFVMVDHGACVCSYLHLSKLMVKSGQRVHAGQLIAVSGNSGSRTTGPHLHLSCRTKNGNYINPLVILVFVAEHLSNQ